MNQLAVTQVDGQERQAFQHMLEQAFAPLMPIAISYGLNSNDLAFAVRAVYLHEMEARLKKERAHEISDARLALVSGMTRSEVARVRRGKASAEAVRGASADQLQKVGMVLTAWHTNPSFSGAYGVPLDLDLEPIEGSSHRSFPKLIEIACADLPEKVTLDELVAHGVAEVVGGKLVRCKARAAISSAHSGRTGLLNQYSRFLAKAAETVAHNIDCEEQGDRYFDRLLTSDMPLSARVVKTFHTRAMAATDAYLTELDGWLSKISDEPNQASDHRYGVGVFFFKEFGDGSSASNEGNVVEPKRL